MQVGRRGMVVTAHPAATLAGIDILRQGGNAVDAAVAAAVAVGVSEPQYSGPGGDVVLQFWDASRKQGYALNACGTAPATASLESFALDPSSLRRGLRSATMPGAVDGWLTAVARWGTMPASQVLAPAMDLAVEGVPMSEFHVSAWTRYADLVNGHPHTAAALHISPLRIGAALRQPALAATLREIAEGGREAFYCGPFAEKLVAYCERKEGLLTYADLARHKSWVADPQSTVYREHTVTQQPLISQGLLLLQMLGAVEKYDLAALSPESSGCVHLLAEISRLALADRDAYLGDDAGSPVDQLLARDYAGRQSKRVNTSSVTARFKPGKLARQPAGPGFAGQTTAGGSADLPNRVSTGRAAGDEDDRPGLAEGTCICVVDSAGNAAVIVQSLGQPFGSGVVVPGTGVLLGNRMSAFSLDPGCPNCLTPGKQPLSPLGPVMVFREDRLVAAGGTTGGDSQLATNLQVITQMIDHRRSLQEAIESPKWQTSAGGGEMSVEERMPLDTCYELRTTGYKLSVGAPWSAPCASQYISLDPESECLLGATDPRAGGLAVGL